MTSPLSSSRNERAKALLLECAGFIRLFAGSSAEAAEIENKIGEFLASAPSESAPIQMPEGVDWRENGEAVSGALICLGGMLYEWGLPLEKAIKGLRSAYELEAEKHTFSDTSMQDAPVPCQCSTERDKALCRRKDRCAEVVAFGQAIGANRHESDKPA